MKIRIKEGLEVLENGITVTDYVGDIVNFLINKPKNYRVVYDSNIDLWAIIDSTRMTHAMIIEYLAKSGFVDFRKVGIDRIRDEDEDYDGYEDYEVYCDYYYGLKRKVAGLIFVPNNSTFTDTYAGEMYEYPTEITTGTIYTNTAYDMKGIFRELYDKLTQRDLLVQ